MTSWNKIIFANVSKITKPNFLESFKVIGQPGDELLPKSVFHPRTQGLIVLFYTDVGHSTLVYSTKISRPGVNSAHLREHRLADRKISFSRIADNKYN